MIKKTILLYVGLFSLVSFSSSFAGCPLATPTNTSAFCSSFKTSAQCHCTASGLPKGMCTNMRSLHDRMISMFGSLRKACEYQHDTTTQNCIDSWNCYRQGGSSEQGLCSGTGSACE